MDRMYGSNRGRQLFIRVSTPLHRPFRPSPLTAIKDFFLSFTGWRFWNTVELWLRHIPKYQTRCYCPTGYTVELHAKVGQYWVLWVTLSRWTGAKSGPCPCDYGLHEYHKSIGEDCQCSVAELEWEASLN